MNGNGQEFEEAAVAALEATLTPEAEAENLPIAAYCEPLFDKLIVRVDPEKAMEGGIVIPDAHKERPYVGTVLRVGEGRLLDSGMICPPRVKEGSRVMFGKYAGIDIPEDYGKRVKVLREDEVLWVFPEIQNTAAVSPEKDAAA